jgi:N-acetylmuramoyl-L-alanine amidase
VIDFPNSSLIDTLKANVNKTILSGDSAAFLTNTVTEINSAADGLDTTPVTGNTVTASTYIDKIRYALYSDKPSTVRVVVDLKQKAAFELTEDKANHKVIISNKKSGYIVVIDPGHGAKDNGATSITGKYEKNLNLSVGLKVQKLLANEPLIQVVMTRTDDTFIELDERVAIANRINASLFVSIHGNAYVKATSGTETYYERAESLGLAQTIHPLVANASGFKNNGIKQNNFRVITKTAMPAILIELGYLTNVNDEAQMYTDAFQDRVAASIAEGIKQYLQIK